jgi:hypothetical protein
MAQSVPAWAPHRDSLVARCPDGHLRPHTALSRSGTLGAGLTLAGVRGVLDLLSLMSLEHATSPLDDGRDVVVYPHGANWGFRLPQQHTITANEDHNLVYLAVPDHGSGYRLDRIEETEGRDVDLTSDLVDLLGSWWGELGRPGDDTLVFPGAGIAGYLTPSTVLKRELYPAMEAADVPRVGPTGEKRTFHSFRHTFAKRALENGRQVTWLSRHLGHSSLKITTDIYGHWERAERKREAELMEGVFGV